MCKQCDGYSSKNIKISTHDNNDIKNHLGRNIAFYKKKFNINDDTKIELKNSERDDKRYSLIVDDLKVADFGYKDDEGHADTFIDLVDKNFSKAIRKKMLYVKRAKRIENDKGQYTYMLRYTPNSLSYWILWHCKDCH